MPRSPHDPKLLAELYTRPGFLLRRAHQINSAIFDAEFREWEITHTQYGLLMAIASFPDVDVVRCGRLTGVDRTTSHLAIRNLERRGWIARRTDPTDARRHLLAATPAGFELLRRTKPVLQRLKKRLLEALAPQEADSLVTLLRRIAGEPTANQDGEAPAKAVPPRATRARKKHPAGETACWRRNRSRIGSSRWNSAAAICCALSGSGFGRNIGVHPPRRK